jgi:hypothetical protein
MRERMKINMFKELEKNRMYRETFLKDKKPPIPEEVMSWPDYLQESFCVLAEPTAEEAALGLQPHDQAAILEVKKSKAYMEWKKGAVEAAEPEHLDVVNSDEHDDQEVFPEAKQSSVSAPPKPPKKNLSAIIEMDDTLRAALKLAGKNFKDHIQESTGQECHEYIKNDHALYDVAKLIAHDAAVGYYVCEKGLDLVNTKTTSIVAEWIKAGWWPPRSSREVHWVDFFTTLSDRVDQGRPWDYVDEAGPFKRRPNTRTFAHEELIMAIKEVVPDANNLSHLVRLLNERNVLTIRGSVWTSATFQAFCRRWMEYVPFDKKEQQQSAEE